MPIYKFKKIEDLQKAVLKGKVPGEFNFFPDKDYYHRVFFELDLLVHVDLPRGVFKFKTLEEANEWLMRHLAKQALKKKK